jgi:hypothetical protein
MLADWWVGAMPPASRSRNQCVGQTSIDSSTLAETGTGLSGSRTGWAERLAARVPHQDDGSAWATSGRVPTVSPASRTNRRAAAARSAAPALGSTRVRRSSLTSPARDSGRSGRPVTASTGTPSSSRNRDGCSPSSSKDATAVTTSRCRARVQAT